uniref:Uncharacterized protein n=1 Tax=Oryza meridionalis TaxID=40149 RepID=A0A0E0ET79_9ORYZ
MVNNQPAFEAIKQLRVHADDKAKQSNNEEFTLTTKQSNQTAGASGKAAVEEVVGDVVPITLGGLGADGGLRRGLVVDELVPELRLELLAARLADVLRRTQQAPSTTGRSWSFTSVRFWRHAYRALSRANASTATRRRSPLSACVCAAVLAAVRISATPPSSPPPPAPVRMCARRRRHFVSPACRRARQRREREGGKGATEKREMNSERGYDRWVPHFFINRVLTGLPRVRHC